jgi:hypothetical protein
LDREEIEANKRGQSQGKGEAMRERKQRKPKRQDDRPKFVPWIKVGFEILIWGDETAPIELPKCYLN